MNLIPLRRPCSFWFGALAAACLTVTSQAAGEAEKAALDFHATSAGAASMKSVFSSFRPGLELRALKDDASVSLRWGTPVADKNRFIALTATAPLDENNDDTTVATLDGFSKAATLELKYNWFRGDGPATARARGDAKAVMRADARTTILDERLAALQEATPAKNRVRLPSDRRRKVAEEKTKHTTLFSASATFGYDSFDYLDGVLLDEKSTDKEVYGGRVSWGRYVWTDAAFALDFEYQEAYEAADEKSFVLPPDVNGLQEVKTGPYGAPSRSIKRLLSVEFRKRLSSRPGNNSGIAVKITYDSVDDVFGVRVPVYFIKDDALNASGGIELGWVDHKDKAKSRFTIAAIVGAGLKFEPF